MAAAKVIKSTTAGLNTGPIANPYTVLALLANGIKFDDLRPRIRLTQPGVPLTWTTAVSGALAVLPESCEYKREVEAFENWMLNYPRY